MLARLTFVIPLFLTACLCSCARDPLGLASSDDPFDIFLLFAGSGGPRLLENYSDEFVGASLDASKWHEQLEGYRDQNPPVPYTWTLAYEVTGGELVITPEPSANADWWNHWYGPGIFSAALPWQGSDYRIDAALSFTGAVAPATHFAALIIQSADNPFNYIKFASFGSDPSLYDMNICIHHNPWPYPTADWGHYLNPTTDTTMEGGVTRCAVDCWATGRFYDSWTKPLDETPDFPAYLDDLFAAFVQHGRTAESVVLRIVKDGSRAAFYYSEDGGATFTRGMSGEFNPANVRIGLVANEMGVPMGGDGKAHFQYIRVTRL